MAEGAGGAEGNNAVRQAVQNAVRDEKLTQLDRVIGHVVSTTRLGWALVGLFIAVLAVVVGLFYTAITELSEQVREQEKSIDETRRTVTDLKEQVTMLNRSLGDAPQILREASLSIKERGENLEKVVSDLDITAASLAPIVKDISDIKQLQGDIQKATIELTDPKGTWPKSWAYTKIGVQEVSNPEGFFFKTIRNIEKNTNVIKNAVEKQ